MWAAIEHVAYDATGGLTAAVERAGTAPVHFRPYLGEKLPRCEDLSGLVVLEAPDGAADDPVAAHLVQERLLLARAVGLGLPVLGSASERSCSPLRWVVA